MLHIVDADFGGPTIKVSIKQRMFHGKWLEGPWNSTGKFSGRDLSADEKGNASIDRQLDAARQLLGREKVAGSEQTLEPSRCRTCSTVDCKGAENR